ncbi:GreA/GreB family elongation factor [Sessilibacter corallicola]|uniref:GreA/GreB family elongation factor n=1 Tax=Sessilibacter corallicola TaxID=2904075 RepID=UPI001E6083A1|nr:GreA/GreB family elongation factor [Sessilibacter corallicola]MCE2029651.1 GreA/GreB family elongation factor [Sessilibacter corallicola]
MPLVNYENWITSNWRDELIQQKQIATNKSDAAEIQNRIDQAVIVSQEDLLESRVQFASYVTVFALEEEEEQSFRIVSEDESLTRPGSLAWSTPLARALLGGKEGQIVTVILENGSNCEYEITHIRTASSY